MHKCMTWLLTSVTVAIDRKDQSPAFERRALAEINQTASIFAAPYGPGKPRRNPAKTRNSGRTELAHYFHDDFM